MKIKIEKAEIPKNRRILVTSDIHGHALLLKRLLGFIIETVNGRMPIIPIICFRLRQGMSLLW